MITYKDNDDHILTHTARRNKVIRTKMTHLNLLFHMIDNDESYRASRSHRSDNIDAQAAGQESLAVNGAAVLP
jgi:hypothetical protein